MAKGVTINGRKTALQSTATEWLNSNKMFAPGTRYVFFQDLYNDTPSLQALGESARTKFSSVPDIIEGKIKDEEDSTSIDYIQAYLHMLRQLADKERSIEEKYVRGLASKLDIPIKEYITDNKFDYIKFINFLNEIESNNKKFKEMLTTQIHNMKEIKKEYDSLAETEADLTEQETNSKKKTKQQIREAFFDTYKTYSNEIASLVSGKLNESIAEIMANTTNTLFSKLVNNQDLIQAIFDDKHVAPNPIQIRNALIDYVQDGMRDPENKTRIINDFETMCHEYLNGKEDNLRAILNKTVNETYQNVLSQNYSEVRKIIQKGLTSRKGLAAVLEKSPASFEMLLDMLQIENKNDPLINIIRDRLEKLTTKLATDADAKEITYARKSVSYFLNKLINTYHKYNTVDYPSMQKYLDTLEKTYVTNFNSKANANDVEWLKKSLIVHVEPFDQGEINGAVEANHKEIIDSLKSKVYGKRIKLKSDLTFTFYINKLNDYAIKYDKGAANNLQEVVDNFHQDFLQRYHDETNNTTNVIAAAKNYIQSMRNVIEAREEFLDKANEVVAKEGEDYLNNTILGSISVKEYKFYNDELGFHAGSLGGSDRVSAAIPNILKMMELGGISTMDADLIIQALLNCFEDSVLGPSYKDLEDHITQYLLGGAAMMLFDDGFANCQAFLDKMKGDLLDNRHLATELPGIGVMHLLYLNGFYIPQSYVLYNIVENLEEIYKDIVDESKFEKLTKDSTKNYLHVNNPINKSTLEQVNAEYDTSIERWNVMGQIADQTVTIKFMFMAGLLDILEDIAKIQNIKT